MTDTRRPIVDRIAAGADFAAREATRPGPHIALDDTIDEADLTPVGDIAASIRRDLHERGISDRDRLIVEQTADVILARLVRRLEVADRINVRIAEVETWRKEMHEWRLKLSGVDDGNGRLGKMDRRLDDLAAEQKRDTERVLAEVFVHVNQLRETDDELSARIGTAAERQVERATSATLRHVGKKILAGVATIGLTVGGFAQCARSRYERAIEIRVEERAWRDGVNENFRRVDRDIDRVFALFNLKRSDLP